MIMIPTKYPYGSVNIQCVDYIMNKFDKYYLVDKCGKWLIEEETYNELKKSGVREYERQCPTT